VDGLRVDAVELRRVDSELPPDAEDER
jgi:hypothetical protein